MGRNMAGTPNTPHHLGRLTLPALSSRNGGIVLAINILHLLTYCM